MPKAGGVNDGELERYILLRLSIKSMHFLSAVLHCDVGFFPVLHLNPLHDLLHVLPSSLVTLLHLSALQSLALQQPHSLHTFFSVLGRTRTFDNPLSSHSKNYHTQDHRAMLTKISFVASLALFCLPLVSAAPTRHAPVNVVTPDLLNAGEAQLLLDTYSPRPSSVVEPNVDDSDLGLVKRGIVEPRQTATVACLGSNTTALQLNTLLYFGYVGQLVTLCPNAYIKLEGPIYFAHSHQEISTQGSSLSHFHFS